jgi:hypothetical protein
MRRARRLQLAVAFLSVVCGPVVAAHAASSAKPTTVSAVYSYHGRAGGVLVVDGEVDARGGVASLAFATVFGSRSAHPLVFSPAVVDADAGRGGLRVITPRGVSTTCALPLTCHLTNSDGIDFGYVFKVGQSDQAEGVRFFLAATGARVTLHDDALRNWSARRRQGQARFVAEGATSGAAVDTDLVDASVSTQVAAAGFRGGSLAVSIPACAEVGGGVWTLSTAGYDDRQLCPVYAVADMTDNGAGWTAHGAAAGITENSTALVVIAQ